MFSKRMTRGHRLDPVTIPAWLKAALLLAASAMLIRAVVDALRLMQAIRLHGF